jgi:uncharacterized protein YbbC (DUF1343 family)
MGAPDIKGEELAKAMNDLKLAGIEFSPAKFTPNASVFKDKPCEGVKFNVYDRLQFNSVRTGIELARAIERLYPTNYNFEKFNTHLRDEPTMKLIESGADYRQIEQSWEKELKAFTQRREKFLLYGKN